MEKTCRRKHLTLPFYERTITMIKTIDPKLDRYYDMQNHKDTYLWIAEVLEKHRCVLVGWHNTNGTHLDILFTIEQAFHTQNVLTIQGGIKPQYLFISIMRMGAFGFDMKTTDSSYEYYAEKLNIKIAAPGIEKLINGVKKEFIKIHERSRIQQPR